MAKVKELAVVFKGGGCGGASNSTTNGTEYHLFGHRIAHISGGDLYGNWCGFATAITQRHLKNIANAFGCPLPVHQNLSRAKGEELGTKDFLMKVGVR